MGPKKKDSKKNKDADKKVSTDPRFASVHLDPRFAQLPKHKAKVEIDSRFDKMFTDKNFATSSAKIDKRGKAKKDSSRDALKRYYRLEEEEEEKKKKEEVKGEEEKKKGKVEDGEENVTDESEEEKKKGKVEDGEENVTDESEEESEKSSVDLSDLDMGSESDLSESEEESEEENGDESADTEEEYEDGVYSEEEDTFVPEENVPEIEKETHRLAVVNLDWGHVRAVDLYVLLSSLKEKGQILSVAVYPSEFGLQRMAEEEKNGPVGLFDDEKGNSGSDDEDDDGEIDNEKLRAYERSKLRYYYAVVECDSVETAEYLYRTGDGYEIEQTSNKLDLRFIPDSMEFKHPPRDVAKEAPAHYEKIQFTTRALQMSKIDLTWDEDEPHRTKSLKRKFNDEQLADLEMKEYLASSESETDEDDENDNEIEQSRKKLRAKEKYLALLKSGEDSDEGDEDDNQDMEVTFNTGLEDLSKRILEKKDAKSETVWEQHLKKMKEKKQARKNRSRDSSEDESDDDDETGEEMDDFFVDESSVKSGKDKNKQKGKNKKEVDKEAEEKSRAELELLLADENGADTGVKGYNMKRQKVKGKKGKEVPDEGKIPTIDYEDPRFSALFTSPLFALDPTDPQFKRSAAYARQLTQKQRSGEKEEPVIKPHEPAELGSDDVSVGKKEKKEKRGLSLLVNCIKMKSKQLQQPTNDKEIESDDVAVSKKEKKEKHELSSLVDAIKMKSKQLQQPSKDKEIVSDDVAVGKKEKKKKHESSLSVNSIKTKSKQLQQPSNDKEIESDDVAVGKKEKKKKHESSSSVNSIKTKSKDSKQLQQPSNDKVSRKASSSKDKSKK